ncbi:MAG: histidine--tRNA ligase [Candidatus Fimisoma sp.]|nr:histidine--tRNA ligase [Bacillota bacterium]MDD7285264.1 histidine--tRNA ligase [Bacillota bacterium]MDY4748357.1 histidine--tRNA ligase [Candidatus Fimisoma sp.]
MLTNAPKGTKDLLPGQVHKWHYVEGKFADICRRYGFKEIRTPMFEHTEVFARGIGDTTDVVQKEMYTFNDHGNRSITLKPEGTSGAVRAFIEHKQYAEVQPTKYYYNTDCFRYEKPQSGRLRHFHQFGIEVFGTPNMMADAEVICLAHDFLTDLGITEIELRINSVGCPECRKKYREALKAYLLPHYEDLCGTCKERFERNPMRIIDCKSEICQAIVKDAPRMIDYLCDDCRNAFEDLKSNLTAMGIDFTIDPNIVRGLDYYTKTAFEFVTTKIGAQGTVCGGGRYDHLVEELGGPPIPGVGFGLGIERLLLLMEANNAYFPEENRVDAFIAVMGDAAKAFGLKLARELRAKGITAEMDTLARNIKGQFKYADRLNARYTLVIGDNELEKGVVSLKDMVKSEQREIKIEDIYKEITK